MFFKDPNATLDYTVDWGSQGWMRKEDSIVSVNWSVSPAGLTIESSSNTNVTATCFVSGGSAGETYKLICQITTAGGRIDERTLLINVADM